MSDEKKGATLEITEEEDSGNTFNFTGDRNDDFNEDDSKNLDEIDKELVKLEDDEQEDEMAELEAEMYKLETQRSLSTDNGVDEEDDRMMAELDAEIEREEAIMLSLRNGNVNGSSTSYQQQQQRVDDRSYNNAGAGGGGGDRTGGSYLPVGATPSRNGVLSPHAAEFWFPECRDCTCCKGFKHGCPCRQGNVTTCQNPNCTSAAGSTSPAASSNNATSSAAVTSCDAPTTTYKSASSAPTPASTTRPTGGYLPPGAVPSQNGVLSPQAAEFWFPECRDCTCCNGFKHGCSCRTKGVNICQQCCGDQTQQPQYTQQQQAIPSSSSQSSYGSSQYSSYSMPPPSSSATPQICRFFAAGRCNYGSTCRFSHNLDNNA